jgi:replicative DNA helicase
MSTLGKKFLAAVVAKGSVADITATGAIQHLFRGSEIPVWGLVRAFVQQYGKVPEAATILAQLGEELPDAPEPPAYYFDLLQVRHVEYELKAALTKAGQQLAPGGEGAEAAYKTVIEVCMDLARKKHGVQLVDLRYAYDLVMGAYVAKKGGGQGAGLLLGWPYLDEMTGGLIKGDLVSEVGRPSLGKTWQMLYGAHHGWLKAELDPESAGSVRLFVSMEMSTLAIAQRLIAMHTHLPAFKIKHGKLGTSGEKKFKQTLTALKGYKAPLWVVDGNLTATVEDVVMLARQLKPDGVWIDGGYLLQHAKAKDRYARVAENLDLIKKELCPIAPTVCSWQFKRSEGGKGKKKADKDLEDIGYSDAIGQHSSLVLGLFEDDSVETLKQRLVKVLKGRNGETGQFKTKWNFDTMDFGPVEEKSLGELQF